MSNRPILFLNVDGVLTSARTYLWAYGGEPRALLDPTAIAMLAQLQLKVELDIIIASNWSNFLSSAEAWTSLFESFGFALPVAAVIDPSVYLNDPTQAIEAVLESRGNPPHVVLDDDPHRESKLRVVLTDRLAGLSVDNVVQVLKTLAPECAMLKDIEELLKSFA